MKDKYNFIAPTKWFTPIPRFMFIIHSLRPVESSKCFTQFVLVWILFRWMISSNDFGNEIGNFVVYTSYSCQILSPWELNHCPITKIDQYENWWMFLLWRPVNRNRAPLNLWFYSIKFIPLVQWRNFVVPKNIITRDPVYSMNTTKCLMIFYDRNLEIHGFEQAVWIWHVKWPI